MKKTWDMIRFILWVPLIVLAAIISNRAPLGEHGKWIKWLPWGRKSKN